MSERSNEFERIVRLEEKMETVITRTDNQEEKIDQLNQDLVAGLKSQEGLLREMVEELKQQQREMHTAYERMSAFTKGVLWLGGIGVGAVAFLIKFEDKIKAFFGG